MKILLLEPFYTSSHQQWADGIVKHSSHELVLKTLPGRHWKWRMHQAALAFAEMVNKDKKSYDVILCTDMMDVAVFKGLLDTEILESKPLIATYFHENQITYPWSPNDQDVALNRDNHYGWINYTSALASDMILFNSHFHMKSFLGALPTFLGQFPDDLPLNTIAIIKNKSKVVPLGFDMDVLINLPRTSRVIPTVLWNHRWEYDKNPELFFETLIALAEEGAAFNLIIAGEKYKRYPTIFDRAKEVLGSKILHFGYARSRTEYLTLLAQSDILPVTSNQDFFGISAVEGIAAGCLPLLPDRLAFPAHLSKENQRHLYFDTDSEFKEKLRDFIKNWDVEEKKYNLKEEIRKYDWKAVIQQFDSTISNHNCLL